MTTDSYGPRGAVRPASMAAYQVGQMVHAVTAKYEAKRTTPPEDYSMDTLLTDMFDAYKFAKTDADRKILKEVEGLGTSRTRRPMMDAQFARGFFITRKNGKRHLVKSTDMARTMMAVLPQEMKDVALTAKWEYVFLMVERGKATVPQVVQQIYKWVEHVVEHARGLRGKVRLQLPSTAGAGAGARRP